jgi:hypothetical protein
VILRQQQVYVGAHNFRLYTITSLDSVTVYVIDEHGTRDVVPRRRILDPNHYKLVYDPFTGFEACPRDTNGDGDCGRLYCSMCGPRARRRFDPDDIASAIR